MSPIIDAHQHFWAPERGDYGWLTPDLTPLYRKFGPEDLKPLLEQHAIAGTVLVQAAPTLQETQYLLGIAEKTAFVKGVVGWVDFEAPNAPDIIAELAAHPKCVGLRPMIQDIEDDHWMLREGLKPALQAMVEHGLVFDALTLPRHLKHLETFIRQNAELAIVIDHASKPNIASGEISDWAAALSEVARLGGDRLYCKFSGLVTEAGPNWSITELADYSAHILEAFGPSRMIWGSDWPVCTLASSYERWFETSAALLEGLTIQERQAVFGGNAISLYRLPHHKL